MRLSWEEDECESDVRTAGNCIVRTPVKRENRRHVVLRIVSVNGDGTMRGNGVSGIRNVNQAHQPGVSGSEGIGHLMLNTASVIRNICGSGEG